jgi:leader peptidase (prepilin peptidase)/N-methyltransferase
MNIFKFMVFGMAGLCIGYKVPDISDRIIRYKRPEMQNDRKSFLNSHAMQFIITIITGALWSLLGNMNNIFVALLIAFQITIGIITAFIDIKIRIIPNELIFIMVILGLLFQIFNFGFKNLIVSAIAMIVMMAVFTAVAGFVGFGKVGAGDVKLAGAMGISLGYPLIIAAITVMAVVLLIFILIGMAMQKIYLSTMLPFAPFMIAGYIAAFVSLLV